MCLGVPGSHSEEVSKVPLSLVMVNVAQEWLYRFRAQAHAFNEQIKRNDTGN